MATSFDELATLPPRAPHKVNAVTWALDQMDPEQAANARAALGNPAAPSSRIAAAFRDAGWPVSLDAVQRWRKS